ncbi:MAG: hypothetical protein ACPHQP_07090 [Longimicrobiales bacterium]
MATRPVGKDERCRSDHLFTSAESQRVLLEGLEAWTLAVRDRI